jgi:hypothetical protein
MHHIWYNIINLIVAQFRPYLGWQVCPIQQSNPLRSGTKRAVIIIGSIWRDFNLNITYRRKGFQSEHHVPRITARDRRGDKRRAFALYWLRDSGLTCVVVAVVDMTVSVRYEIKAFRLRRATPDGSHYFHVIITTWDKFAHTRYHLEHSFWMPQRSQRHWTLPCLISLNPLKIEYGGRLDKATVCVIGQNDSCYAHGRHRL